MSNYAELAVKFLRTMEAGDLDGAEKMLTNSARFIFPGPVEYPDLRTCSADRRTRYKSIRKKFEGQHVAPLEDGSVAVYCFGTLHGVALDDSPIEDVRFIDRFIFEGDLIARQDVWNDLSL